MTGLPWFKFYAADFLTDAEVDDLCLEAQAILTRLWSVLWIEGALPQDAEELARKCKVRSDVMKRHLNSLIGFLLLRPDGMYISERMEKEKTRSNITSQSRRDASNKRWRKAPKAIASAKSHPTPNANGDLFARDRTITCSTVFRL